VRKRPFEKQKESHLRFNTGASGKAERYRNENARSFQTQAFAEGSQEEMLPELQY
jgi:hypothetical protein